MKYLATFLLMLSLSAFAIGCKKADDTAAPANTPDTEEVEDSAGDGDGDGDGDG